MMQAHVFELVIDGRPLLYFAALQANFIIFSELCLQLMLVTANMMQGVGAGELRWHLQS